MRDIRLDTLMYTGWNYLASSCWLQIQQVGEPVLSSYRCTTRNGLLCSEREDNINGFNPTFGIRVHYEISGDLNNNLRDLTDALLGVWQDPDGSAASREDRRIGTTNWQASDVHHFSFEGNRRDSLRECYIPRLMEDVPYRIRMDWAFPYCLVMAGERNTRLFPFGLRTSRIGGSDLQGDWNRPQVVRFRRSGHFEDTGIYETEILDGHGSVLATIAPSRLEAGDPSWMRGKARLRLPHSDGFLLLHKFFIMTIAAYDLLNAYRLAQANVQRDISLLGQIEHLVELSGCSSRGTDTHRQVAQAFGHINRFRAGAQSFGQRIDDRFVERSHPFRFLLDFWSSPDFQQAWTTDWYRFTNFLGPLTFMEIAVWLIRQSPLSDDFYRRYGRQILQHVGVTWNGVHDQNQDPMLVDRRADIQGPTIAGIDTAMSWTKRSVMIYSSINQMFYFYHASSLISEGYANQIGRGHFPFRPTRDDLKAFVRFITGIGEREAAAFMDEVVSGPTRAFSPSYEGFRRQIRTLRFASRIEGQKIADAVDGLQRVLRLLSLGESLYEHGGEWSPENLQVAARDMLGLSKSAAALLGAKEAAVVRFAILPAAAAVEVFIYASSAYEDYERADYYRGSMRTIQAAGTVILLCSEYTVAVPGVGIPTATILVTIGTVLVLGAEVALWIEQNVNDDWENHAKRLYGRIFGELVDYQWDEIARRAVTIGEFADLLYAYGRQKGQWQTAEMDHRTIWWLIDDDTTWFDFPEWRWRYLEYGGENRAETERRYIEYCRGLDPRWNRDARTGELPPPPPLPFPRPR